MSQCLVGVPMYICAPGDARAPSSGWRILSLSSEGQKGGQQGPLQSPLQSGSPRSPRPPFHLPLELLFSGEASGIRSLEGGYVTVSS